MALTYAEDQADENKPTSWDFDPFLPILSRLESSNRKRQWERRATILARARTHLARDGYGGVIVRNIAEESGVAVQTVYNLVGDKTELMAEAITEYVTFIGTEARKRTDYPNPILAMADCYWSNFIHYRNFVHEVALACLPPHRSVRDRVVTTLTEITLADFAEMRARGVLRSGVPCRALASRIHSTSGLTILDHAPNRQTSEGLRYELLTSAGWMILHAVIPEEARKIEDWLNATFNQNRAQRFSRSSVEIF